jgi:hypothetical protein
MLQEVRSSHEEYQKRIKLMYRGFGAMLLVFMLFDIYVYKVHKVTANSHY